MFPPQHLLREMQSLKNMHYPFFTVDNLPPLLDRERVTNRDILETCKMSFTEELLASKFEDVERDIKDLVRSKDTLPPVRMVSSDERPLLQGAMRTMLNIRKASIRWLSCPPKLSFENSMRP